MNPIGRKFREWLAAARITDDPAGDFITDARADSDPPEPKSLDELVCYLWERGACQGALDSAPEVWRRFCNWLRRHPYYFVTPEP